MRWNKDTVNGDYTVTHVTEQDINNLATMTGCSWHDAEAFLKNAVTSILFPEKVDFKQLLLEAANGEYGEIEGACNRYQSRHFEGNLISMGN